MSAGRPPFRGGRIADAARGASAFDAGARRDEVPAALPASPECPFCDGTETEIMSGFGSHASVSTYWCRACRSPFEVVKWRGGG